jgi:ABC-type transport system involved in cytochrome c biogenesis ATPase subunit
MPAHPHVLEVLGLGFGWPGRRLFDHLTLRIPPGVSLVTGDDGCGKSTLLRLLAGELQAQAGTFDVQGIGLEAQRSAYRQRVFWIDPQTEAHDAISAAGYLDSLRQHCPGFSADALADLVDGFSLTPHLHKPLYMLSAGSKRKVWLSAAFASGAAVTLIDQPFAALDGPSIRFLHELLLEVADHPTRAWVLADFQAPAGVPLASVIAL